MQQGNVSQNASQLKLLKLYLKEAAFEMPEGSKAFQANWTPELNVELHTATKALAEKNTHDVVLTVKCTVANQGKTAFVVEVKQAGIFEIVAQDPADLPKALGTVCPTILYPSVREAVSNLVMKGGFPRLWLAPINFDVIYEQQLEQQKEGNNNVPANDEKK